MDGFVLDTLFVFILFFFSFYINSLFCVPEIYSHFQFLFLQNSFQYNVSLIVHRGNVNMGSEIVFELLSFVFLYFKK